eukprot:CAMPEP_0172552596 /NCGR_PEP_ID=MMETSP1067-20121228/46223_1 /TAXON_ID=265564 ORGANISM="Thalassiosira punctigera, Strain Tpunct2005C2" /NCGR_SAMPLE_ID=MMETSP1067 /ASSEMBLY_ACC=CAM_ASM_000444 /LENGTH=960 /DNA_ID=CAMNT_0013340615 /DNA_START=110 /DNA_END=2995 /DNA_ORIENTATION=+
MPSKSSSSSASSSPSSASVGSSSDYVIGLALLGAVLYAIGVFLQNAYEIRLQAIQEFGPVIHEFDPYFNWRATQYLDENGSKKFFTWFDHKVWYPLGRPVGSTIYPGMQFTAVYLKRYVFGDSMSLNDVCCYIPVWFGVAATFLVGCIAFEASLPENSGGHIFGVVYDALRGKYSGPESMRGASRPRLALLGLSSPSLECAAFAIGFMGVVPAHLMRSVGGGYDNESVAVTAMTLTFWLWMRSLRSGEEYSYLVGVFTGLAYFYMAAAWGGYIFVLNLIAAHAAFLVVLGRFSTKVYKAYSLFYVVGTSLAIQIPVVGWSPLKSLEQLPACAVFLGYQLLHYCEVQRKKKKLTRGDAFKLRVQVAVGALAVVTLLVMLVTPSGYFGPISSRVRGLFVPHTKTGNPLVDSVAEHQAASQQAYWQYLHILCFLAPAGFVIVLFRFGDSASFLFVYAITAYFFSHKMVRLVLLTAPIASALGGIAVGRVVAWSVSMLLGEGSEVEEKGTKKVKANGESKSKSKDGKKKKEKKSSGSLSGVAAIRDGFMEASKSTEGKIVKAIAAVVLLGSLYMQASSFKTYAWKISASLSNPSIILKGQTREGNIIKVDDYREAYWWLRDNTPEDARIMAWWDYGYQITGIANRTTIADGNTWNHEHIALLGKALTGSVEEGYQIARHLADYVLIWGGGGGDDLAKSPHLARIANSVYRDHCPGDVTCRQFGFVDRQGTPSAMMEESFLYALHSHRLKPGVIADPEKFEPVYRSKYGKVRIYKLLGVSRKSKRWVEQNRQCDAGGWFCPGQYPPGLREILAKKKDFAQLEDFNRGASDEQYQKEYFENLNNPELARKRAEMKKKEEGPTKSKNDLPAKTLSDEEKIEIYSRWEDTEDTTLMWKIVNGNAVDDLERWLKADPGVAWLRSGDGRGPMWWAFESKNQDIVTILMKMGVPHSDKDKNGLTPVDLLKE